MEAGSQYLKLRGLVVAAARVCFGSSGLLKVDFRQALLRACQNVLALNEEWSSPILDFEIWLAVFDDVSDVTHAWYLAQMPLEMVLGNAAADSGGKPKRSRNNVKYIARGQSKLQFQGMRLGPGKKTFAIREALFRSDRTVAASRRSRAPLATRSNST